MDVEILHDTDDQLARMALGERRWPEAARKKSGASSAGSKVR